MSRLREKIEFYPPGLIIIRGAGEAAAFLDELPPERISELAAKGYCFFVLPVGVSLEAVPDDVLEQAHRERQRARRPRIKLAPDGMH